MSGDMQDERRKIQEAIEKILAGGQEYQLEGMRIKRPGLSQLYARLDDIDRQTQEAANGGGFEKAVFDRG
jgi:hypothetical protein